MSVTQQKNYNYLLKLECLHFK